MHWNAKSGERQGRARNFQILEANAATALPRTRPRLALSYHSPGTRAARRDRPHCSPACRRWRFGSRVRAARIRSRPCPFHGTRRTCLACRRLNVLDHDSHFLTTSRAPGKLVEIGHAVRWPVVDGGSDREFGLRVSEHDLPTPAAHGARASRASFSLQPSNTSTQPAGHRPVEHKSALGRFGSQLRIGTD